ncbi:MAG: hypothetical protein FWG80_00850 [Alphaproteobacteria bacterium]|nr:hypothetical protein [Alphaproteobacteria bacterium]
MKKIIFVLVMLLSFPALGFVGRTDPREKLDWNANSHSGILRFVDSQGGNACTAQFVAPDIIMTAAHCVNESRCHYMGDVQWCMFADFDGNYLSAAVVASGNYVKGFPPLDLLMSETSFKGWKEDWVLLRADISSGLGKYQYYNVKPSVSKTGTKIDRIGFGTLRVLEDWELKIIRNKALVIIRGEEYDPEQDEKLLSDGNSSGDGWASRLWEFIDTLNISTQEENSGGSAIEPIFYDGHQLKIHRGCSVVLNDGLTVFHDCISFGGDSGGVIAESGTMNIEAVASGSVPNLSESNDRLGFGVATSQFYEALQELLNAKTVGE